MQDLIQNLDDATAIRVLRTFAAARSRHGDFHTQWTPELRQAFLEQTDAPEVRGAASEGDLAREALCLLAEDPQTREALETLIAGPQTERFLDASAIAVGVAALIALQTHVKFERTTSGKLHILIEKKPLPVKLMKKLLAYFAPNPGGKE